MIAKTPLFTAQRLLLGIILLFIPLQAQQAALSKQDILQAVRDIIESAPHIHPQVSLDLGTLLTQDVATLNEAHFIDIIEKVFVFAKDSLSPEQYTSLKKIQNGLKNKLKTYKAVGPAFTIGSNVAMLGSIMTPCFEVVYKDPKGHTKRRKYQASIKTFGINLEFALRPSWIFFTGDANYFDTNKTLDLGVGIELTPSSALIKWPFLKADTGRVVDQILNHAQPNIGAQDWKAALWLANFTITYCPFKHARGGLMIISVPLGVAFHAGLAFVGGGTLIPMDSHSYSLASGFEL